MLPDNFVKVGFAAETDELLTNAHMKLTQKRLDLIAANDVNAEGSGFETDTNKVTIIDRGGEVEDFPLMSKHNVAEKILDRVVGLLSQRDR